MAKSQDDLLHETFEGIREGTNPIPAGVKILMVITIITAFLVTFPLWGQRAELNSQYWMTGYVHPLGGEAIDPTAKAVQAAAAGQPLPVDVVVDTWGLNEQEQNIFISVVKSTSDFDEVQKTALLLKLEAKAPKGPEEEAVYASIINNTMDYDAAAKQALVGALEQRNNEGKAYVVHKTHLSKDRNQPWWDKGYMLTLLYTVAFLVWTSAVIARTPTQDEY